MFLLCTIWAFQQIVIKGGAAHIAPVLQLAIRFAIASLCFGGWVLLHVALLGIAVASLGGGGRSTANLIIGDLLALCGGISWGLSNVVLRRGRIGAATTSKTVFYQLATATLVLGAFAAATGQTRLVLSPLTVGSLIFQTLIVANLSYLLWFWLLRHYLTSRLMLLSLLTPLLAVLFGGAFLGEVIDTRFALGAVLVIMGVLIVMLRSRSMNASRPTRD